MKAAGSKIETAAFGHIAQTIGKTFVVYRQRKNNPTITLPGSKKAGAKKAAPKRAPTKKTAGGKPADTSRRRPRPAPRTDADDWGSVDQPKSSTEIVEIG